MCGIAGILKVHPVGTPPPAPEVAIPEAWLDVLDDSIKHRGPDGQGRFRDRVTRPDGSVVDVAFVHRRLSIIDHAGGRQPMVSERGPWPEKPRNGRVAVVFNGCIYNHRELRRELQSAGHRFVSDHSDTEVLIHGWREWGHELFAKLDGMFAVAIWDASSGAIVLTRDRFGEKPLYETDHGTMYVFASCVPGLVRIRHMSVPRSSPFSHAAQFDCVARWMRFGWDTELPVARIIATPPGFVHRNATDVVVCETGVMNDWGTRLQFDGRRESIRVMEVDALLSAAVRSRLDADASVGVFLSGGIDSALVAAFAREDSRSVDAFTVRMPIAQFDESEAAAQTARHLGVRHHVLACDANPATDLVQTVTQLGLPFGDSSLLPSVWVSRAARSAVKVAIGGDGGDELFLGYERHRIAGIFSRLKRVPSRLLRFGARLFGGLDVEFNRRRRVARFFDAAAHDGYVDLLSIFPRSLYEQVTGYDAQKSASRHRSGRALRGHCEDPELAANEAYEVDLQGYLPEDILRKTDTASMAVGLEVRAPFLARELVDRMIRVRPDVLMPDGERKGLLKQVARKYLPDSIVDRPKMGFSIPIGEWFRTDYGGMKQLLLDTLGGPDPFPEDLLGITINRRFVATMVEDHMSRRSDHSQRLYMLLVLAIWAEWLRGVQRGS